MHNYLKIITVIFSVWFPTHTLAALDHQAVKSLLIDYIGREASHLGISEAFEVIITGTQRLDAEAFRERQVTPVYQFELDPKKHSFRSRLRIMSPQGNLMHLAVQGRIESMILVPMVKVKFKQGDIITEEDITEQLVATKRLSGKIITDKATLIGKTPRRSLMPGQMIAEDAIKLPDFVTRNQSVLMKFTNKHMDIQTLGIALESGTKGDTIRVRNAKSGIVVHASVVEEGVVSVSVVK